MTMLKVLQLAGDGQSFYIVEEGKYITRPYTYQQAINQLSILKGKGANIKEVMDQVRDSLPVDLAYIPNHDLSLRLMKNGLTGEMSFNLYTSPIWVDQTRGRKKEEVVTELYLPKLEALLGAQESKDFVTWLGNIVQNRRNHLVPVVVGEAGVIVGPLVELLVGSSNFLRTYRIPTEGDTLYKQVIHWREATLKTKEEGAQFRALFQEHLNFLLTTDNERAVVPEIDDKRLWFLKAAPMAIDSTEFLDESNIRGFWLWLMAMELKIPVERPITLQLAQSINQSLMLWERKFLGDFLLKKKVGALINALDATEWVHENCAGELVGISDFYKLSEKSQILVQRGASFGAFKVVKPDDAGSDYVLEVTREAK
jgi:hypothetical protein